MGLGVPRLSSCFSFFLSSSNFPQDAAGKDCLGWVATSQEERPGERGKENRKNEEEEERGKTRSENAIIYPPGRALETDSARPLQAKTSDKVGG